VKGILTLTVAALALSSMAQARSNWIRRLSAAAVCAASGADLATTAIGTNRGAIEQNWLLSRNGRPLWGPMIGLNAASCVGAIVGAKTTRIPSYVVVPVNIGFAVPKFAAVGQNINQLQNMK
jgi:hypothetical protein